MLDLSRQKIDVSCPTCGRSTTITLVQVSRQSVINCACGQAIQIIDEGGKGKKTIDSINKTLKNIQRTLKRKNQ